MRIASVLVILLLLALAAAPAAATDVRAQNRAWLLGQLGEGFDPEAHYTGVAGSAPVTLTGAEVVERALDRFGGVDMAALAAAAVAPAQADVGSFWVISFGSVTCPAVLVPVGVSVPLDPQLWLQGSAGSGSTSGFGYTVGWTTKTLSAFSGTLHYAGVVDSFCFAGFYSFLVGSGVWYR